MSLIDIYYTLLRIYNLVRRDDFMKYKCDVCGFVYNEDDEGTKFDELPEDWTCPLCGASKDMFSIED